MAEHDHNPPYSVGLPDHIRENRDRKCGKGFTIIDVVVSGGGGNFPLGQNA